MVWLVNGVAPCWAGLVGRVSPKVQRPRAVPICWDCSFFFPPHLFPRRSVALTVLLGSLQAHDGHEGQKSRAQVCLNKRGGDWRKEGPAGLPPRVGSS